MLHSDLLRLINTREAWALVGSGPSIEAGCPSWDALLAAALKAATLDEAAKIKDDLFYRKAADSNDLPAAFQAAEDVIGRAALEQQ